MYIRVDYNAPIVVGGSFTWGEHLEYKDPQYIRETGERYAEITDWQHTNIIRLYSRIQPLRDKLKMPLIVKSGQRTPAYTAFLRRKNIPAALKSAHMDGMAVDLWSPGIDTLGLYNWMRKHWHGRLEDFRHTPGWVHLDIRAWGQLTIFTPQTR